MHCEIVSVISLPLRLELNVVADRSAVIWCKSWSSSSQSIPSLLAVLVLERVGSSAVASHTHFVAPQTTRCLPLGFGWDNASGVIQAGVLTSLRDGYKLSPSVNIYQVLVGGYRASCQEPSGRDGETQMKQLHS